MRVVAALVLAVLVFVAAPAAAQAPVLPHPVPSTYALTWDQDAPTLADAQANQYFLNIDGVRSPAPMLPITCSGTASPFVCKTAAPAMTPGQHSLAVVAAMTVDGNLLESLPSAAYVVRLVPAPSAPRNPRIVKQ